VSSGRRNCGWVGLLDWMARIRVASVEAAGISLGVTTRQVQMHGRKLEQMGFIERRRMDDGGGGVMVVTPRGVREAGYEVRSGTSPKARTSLLHGRGVSWVAAYCDVKDRPWFGPLELRENELEINLPARTWGPRTHLPDLACLMEKGEICPVEFERVPKSRERLRMILGGFRTAQLIGEVGRVFYVCGSPSVERLVAEVAHEVDRGTGDLGLVIRSLDQLISDTCAARK
jgi:hypothetical protein